MTEYCGQWLLVVVPIIITAAPLVGVYWPRTLAQRGEDVFRKHFGDIVLLFLHFLSEFMMFEISPFLPHRKEKFLSSFVI